METQFHHPSGTRAASWHSFTKLGLLQFVTWPCVVVFGAVTSRTSVKINNMCTWAINAMH